MPPELVFYCSFTAALLGEAYVRGYTSALARLPSTFLHEMAHYLVAHITGSHPSPIDLVPRFEEGGWTLGAVSFHPRRWSAAFVALAPLLLMGLARVLWDYRRDESVTTQLLCGASFAYALRGAIPSRTDWAIALRYPAGLTLIALTAFSVLRLLVDA